MKHFDYFQPTKILFGAGRAHEAGAEASEFGTHCLLVTVSAFPEIEPVFAKVRKSLEKAGLKVTHFDGVVPNPTTDVVTQGAELAKSEGVDVVLGLGGGSSMDTAKAIAVEATHDGTAWDYLFFRDKQPTEKTLPIIAVTTTSGTGSQVTQVAVVTNTEERSKSALFNTILYPDASIVDPELMLSVPEHVTASTGFDVFAHAFESYINPGGSPYTNMMALESIRLVAENLPKAVKNGNNINARSGMAWADTLAGLCIANAGVTLPHGIGMAIGGLYPHVMHGEALAAVYPSILHYSYTSAPKKFAEIGRIFDTSLGKVDDQTAAEKSCEALESFIHKIGMKLTLEDLKVPEKELDKLAETSMVLPDYQNHPRVATLAEIRELLEKSFS